MSRRRLAAVVAAFALVTAGTAAAVPAQALPPPPPPPLPTLNFIGSIVVKVLIGGADSVRLQVVDTAPSDTEPLAAVVDEPGVGLGAGTATVKGSGGTEPVTIPMTNVLGGLHNGDKVQATVSDVETSGGLQNATTAKTTTLTCALDAASNGSCS